MLNDIKDKGQGTVLLAAKKYYCGDEWDKRQMSKEARTKWKNFLVELNLWDNKFNKPLSNVNYLLEFAGYVEQGGKIEVASQYRAKGKR